MLLTEINFSTNTAQGPFSILNLCYVTISMETISPAGVCKHVDILNMDCEDSSHFTDSSIKRRKHF